MNFNDRDVQNARYLSDDPDLANHPVAEELNAVLEGEITDLLGIEKGERSTTLRWNQRFMPWKISV
ncbi:MAG: hypothetical protein OXC80_05010 [Gammaproteobacteria bacterium]|nr:hypothetical protein [Gammaproteobacteria bacterium]